MYVTNKCGVGKVEFHGHFAGPVMNFTENITSDCPDAILIVGELTK